MGTVQEENRILEGETVTVDTVAPVSRETERTSILRPPPVSGFFGLERAREPRSLRARPPSLLALHREVELAVQRSVEHCLDTQKEDGSWEAIPDARILETALTAYALSCTPENADRDVVDRARRLLHDSLPQNHSTVAFVVENALRAIALGVPWFELDLTQADLSSPVYRSRAWLLHVLALDAEIPVKASCTEEELRQQVSRLYEQSGRALAKQWSKVELTGLYCLLEGRAGNQAAAERAVSELARVQSENGGFFSNPVSSAVAYLALARAAPLSAARSKCREYLLATQQSDASWRFCTSDVWDTVLTVRSFRGHPLFDLAALARATAFLLRTQNSDGGWSFRSGVESDNDTTAAAILALHDTPSSRVSQQRAIECLALAQMPDGLWRTWGYANDPPVEDVNAHVIAALEVTRDRHSVETESARRWLGAQYERKGHWEGSWYHGVPYAACEVSEALGPEHPYVRAMLARVDDAQNLDGGWGDGPRRPSLPSATGLTLSALMRRGWYDHILVRKALEYLVSYQHRDGIWPGVPEMCGPRPLLSHYQTHTQAFATSGMIAYWKRLKCQK